MKASKSPFRSLALLSTAVALHASCSIITQSQLEDKPLSSTSSGEGLGGNGNGGAGGAGSGGIPVGGGGAGGAGACGNTCSASQTCCTDACADVKTDTAHCGGCDKPCAMGALCCDGTCAECCMNSDCPTQDHTCIGGACILGCTPPKVDCGTVCSIVATDSKNCGKCGNDCLSGHACLGGICQSGWATMSTVGALSKRQHAAATWTGSRLFVWGGQNPQGALDDGALYDPKTDTWTMLPTTNAPSARADAIAVTMNDKVLVWGGGPDSDNTAYNTGKLYDLGTSEWKDVATVQSARRSPVAVWTGSKVLIWGGTSSGAAIAGGVLYDPATNTWAFTSAGNAPTARTNVGWAWSGKELLLFGGRPGGAGSTNEGYAYDPVLNTWRKLPSTGALTARFDVFATWTGKSMLVFGGRDVSTFADAAQYNPMTDMWTAAMPNPLGKRSAPRSRTGWTSSGTSKIFVAGGLDETQAIKVDCRVYDSSVNDWGAQIPAWPSMSDHEYGVAVWTGAEFILWSGLDNSVLTSDGDRYRP